MDVNETIVQAWLETKGFLVRGRLRYDMSGGNWGSVSDIDLIAYNPKTDQRVAVLVTAWLTQNISPSYIKSDKPIGKKLTNFCSVEASKALEDALCNTPGIKYQRWLILGKYSKEAELAIRTGFPHIDEIIPFRQVMQELVKFIKNGNASLPHESEALETIRALHWCQLI
jgi:hypothetical protein